VKKKNDSKVEKDSPKRSETSHTCAGTVEMVKGLKGKEVNGSWWGSVGGKHGETWGRAHCDIWSGVTR